MTYTRFVGVVLSFCLCAAGLGSMACARVSHDDGKTYITDRTGERWEMTEAETLGFQAHRFQYGIGRNAFQPLGDEDLSKNTVLVPPSTRVIGVSNEQEAHAYSVRKLSRDEIANAEIGEVPIAVAY